MLIPYSLVYSFSKNEAKINFENVIIGDSLENQIYPQIINTSLSKINIKNFTISMNNDYNLNSNGESYFTVQNSNLLIANSSVK